MKCNENAATSGELADGKGALALTRRAALTRLIVLPVAVVLGCSRDPKCDDTSSLSPDDAKIRNEVAGYVEQSPDVTKHCSACAQYVTAKANACGTCKLVKGPINPGGTCKLFVAGTPS